MWCLTPMYYGCSSTNPGSPPWTAIEKLPPPFPEILVLGPPESPDVQSFLAPQSLENPHGSTKFSFTTPWMFVKRGDMKLILIPRSTALLQKQCDCHLHFCITALGPQYMPEKAPITADFSLMSSLPPPTSEIVNPLLKKTIAVHGGSPDFCWNSP